mmetsp:Transcript_32819/g.37335  ORF Transcript_32819/g.37335 Transcript_32819/m.37335 type:complete len:155 (+) Transcript_32819:142-606(+)
MGYYCWCRWKEEGKEEEWTTNSIIIEFKRLILSNAGKGEEFLEHEDDSSICYCEEDDNLEGEEERSPPMQKRSFFNAAAEEEKESDNEDDNDEIKRNISTYLYYSRIMHQQFKSNYQTFNDTAKLIQDRYKSLTSNERATWTTRCAEETIRQFN